MRHTLMIHRTLGEGRGHLYSVLSLPLAHKHSDIYLQINFKNILDPKSTCVYKKEFIELPYI